MREALLLGVAVLCADGCLRSRPTGEPQTILKLLYQDSGTIDRPVAALLPLSAPDALACLLTAEDWNGAVHLSFHGGSAPFAELDAARTIELRIPIDETAWVMIDADAYAVRLRGHAPSSDVTLFPTHPFVVEEALVMTAETHLTYSRGEVGRLTVEFVTDDHVRILGKREPLRLGCQDVALTPWSFDPSDVFDSPPLNAAMDLGTGAPVLLSATPAGAAVAELTLRPGEPSAVRVLATDGAMVRILWAAANPAVVGWVPQSALVPAAARSVLTHAPPVIMGVRSPVVRIACDTALELFATAGGEQRTIGTVTAQSRIIVDGESSPGLSRIVLADATASPSPEATWFVRTTDLGPCTATVH
jgi:hypothetical protein